jgi:hypothetical protein
LQTGQGERSSLTAVESCEGHIPRIHYEFMQMAGVTVRRAIVQNYEAMLDGAFGPIDALTINTLSFDRSGTGQIAVVCGRQARLLVP